jgi:tetratricopeptide (TPR) repeat protein
MGGKIFFFICMMVCNTFIINATPYTYEYTAHCHKAYQNLAALRMEEGRAELVQEIKEHPRNLMATYIADYDDFLTLIMNGSPVDMEQRMGHMEERLKLLQRGDEQSPWYLFCKAGVHMHWAMVYLRMGEYIPCAWHFRKSFLLLKENNERFPAFTYNNIFLGIEQAVVGAIPDEYKWLAAVLGMKGDIVNGMLPLETFVQHKNSQTPFGNELEVYYCYFEFYLLHHQQEVWKYMCSKQYVTEGNLLNMFVKINIGLNAHKAEEAKQMLQVAQRDGNYNKYPIFDYEAGNSLMFSTDKGAIAYYNKFLNRYKGRLFIKDVWQKMAYLYYMQGDMKTAAYCREQIKSNGNKQVDGDKQAQRFAYEHNWPHKTLLEVRWLTDGGYYKQALELIGSSKESDYKDNAEKSEYYFRLGRVYDELGMDEQALHMYEMSISKGRDKQEHFAARAALQRAFIYEEKGDIVNAKIEYNDCLHMKKHDFQSSIDQQAKAGMNRLNRR